jgi:large subunit ribosomal protein L3
MLGLIGQKLGMTQVFDEVGRLVPVTVIKVEPNVVVDRRTVERDGYSAVLLGSFDAKPSRVNKPRLGQFEKAGVGPKKRLVEFRDFDNECGIGESLSLELFADVRFVDIIGVSKGKGYQGVMKRHGFHGGRKTHGSKFHRAPGSIGMAATPSRVLKGTKMAGRMGGERTTIQNLKVLRVDVEQQIILVNGAVPGTKEGYVLISTARKKN